MMLIRPIGNSPQARTAVTEPALVKIVERVFLDAGLGGELRRIEHLAIGGQARLLLVQRSAGEPLVVKVFNPTMPQASSALASAYDTLVAAHRALDAREYEGWTIRVPRTIHKSDHDLVMVMTLAAGRSVYSMLSDHDFDDARLNEIASTIASTMQYFWAAAGRQYGDMNLHNVLCDVPSRQLWLLDAGLPADRWKCADAPARWAPASRDLGYLTYYAASGLRATLGNPVLRRRHRWMSRRVVSCCIQSTPVVQRDDFLREIRDCAAIHLNVIAPSCSLAGLWRWFVKRSAARSLGRMLRQLSSASTESRQQPLEVLP